MTASTRVVLKAFGTRQVREDGVHSPEGLKLIVSASRRLGILAPPKEELIHRELELENISVREIMVPRRDIFSLPETSRWKKRCNWSWTSNIHAFRFTMCSAAPNTSSAFYMPST